METGIVEPATGHTYVAVTYGSADSVESSDANASGANASGTNATGENASDTNASGSRYHKCTECGILEEHTSGTGGVCTVCGYGKKVEVVKMSLELSTATMEYIGVNLYIDAPDGTVFYLDGQVYELLAKDSIGLNKIQYKCAPKELADKHILTTADSSGNSLCITDTSNDVYEYIYSGEMYCKYIVAA